MKSYSQMIKELNIKERKLVYKTLKMNLPEKVELKIKDSRDYLLDKGYYVVNSYLSSKKSPLILNKNQENYNNSIGRLMGKIENKKFEKILGMFSGTVSGLGGIGFTMFELPFLVGIIISYNYKEARNGCVAYENENFDIFAVSSLIALISDRVELKDKYLKLAKSIEISCQSNCGIDRNKIIKDLSEVITRSLLSRKALQTIPVAGAGFGFFINYGYMRRIQKFWDIQRKKKELYKDFKNE